MSSRARRTRSKSDSNYSTGLLRSISVSFYALRIKYKLGSETIHKMARMYCTVRNFIKKSATVKNKAFTLRKRPVLQPLYKYENPWNIPKCCWRTITIHTQDNLEKINEGAPFSKSLNVNICELSSRWLRHNFYDCGSPLVTVSVQCTHCISSYVKQNSIKVIHYRWKVNVNYCSLSEKYLLKVLGLKFIFRRS